MAGRPGRLRGYAPEGAIVLAAVLYGSTFALVKDALDHATPSGFNALRFALGALVLAPFALRRGWRGPAPRPGDGPRTLFVGGIAIGALASVAYWAQNTGLQHTTVSNSAFITGLFAVFTPIVEAIVFRRRPREGIVIAVGLAMLGLFLLTGAHLHLNRGDAITLITAVAFGVWYVLIGIYVPRVDVLSLTCVQLGTISVFSFPLALAGGFGQITTGVVIALVFTGIGCSAIAFSLSTWAQRTIDPSRASLLNLLEPVVAGIVGYAVGERLGVAGYLGALLILAGILVAERGTHRAGARAAPASG